MCVLDSFVYEFIYQKTMANKIIDLALSFDLVIFGGYLRDVEVCGMTQYNDIDILWPNVPDRDSLFEKFMRVLELDNPGAVTKEYVQRHYGHNIASVTRVKVGDVSLDIVMYGGSVEDWMSAHDVDFSCNLFYRTRAVSLGLRYIPKCYENTPNPVQEILELTHAKKFRVILELDGYNAWARAINRGFEMVFARGWNVKGEFLDEYAEHSVTSESKMLGRRLAAIKASQTQHV